MDGQPQVPESSAEVTRLLERAAAGGPDAAEKLLPLVYGELRKLAAAKMAREAPGHTLQATALVHEAWLRLGADRQPAWRSRAEFFAAAAEAMRRILIENARRKGRIRHGGGLKMVDADEPGLDLAARESDEQLLLLHEALDALVALNARAAEIVKQWYFVGMTLDEIADVLGISATTAKRDLAYARIWLYNEIKRQRR